MVTICVLYAAFVDLPLLAFLEHVFLCRDVALTTLLSALGVCVHSAISSELRGWQTVSAKGPMVSVYCSESQSVCASNAQLCRLA